MQLSAMVYSEAGPGAVRGAVSATLEGCDIAVLSTGSRATRHSAGLYRCIDISIEDLVSSLKAIREGDTDKVSCHVALQIQVC